MQTDLFFFMLLIGKTIIEFKWPEDYEQLFISFVHKVLIYFKIQNLEVK